MSDWQIYALMAAGLGLVFGALGWYAHERRKWIKWKKAWIAAHPVRHGDPPYTSQHLRMLYDREQERIRLAKEAEERAKRGEKLDQKGQVTPAETDSSEKPAPKPPPPVRPGSKGSTMGR